MIRAFALLLLPCCLIQADDATERRRQTLAELRRVLPPTRPPQTGRITPHDKTWEDWLARTGELPPDFASLPRLAALPDPLRGVTTPAQWQARRREIRAAFEQYVFGRMPPAPTDLKATVTATRQEGGITVRDVMLTWGPWPARLRVQLLIPPGKGPFPVFLTNHPRNRPWVATAVRRGYLGAIYFAMDPVYGPEDDSDKWLELYPEYDWSCLARWAWAGMRAVDHLVTLPEVDRARIGITGHSRNGKQALLAAAFDERIGAVIASSGNTGESTPWRYTTEAFVTESLEKITRVFPHWFHPRLRFFTGREHQLPVDQHSLMALIAPRGLLLASAWSESQGAPWGIEQAWRGVQPVYAQLNAPGKLGIALRAGEHSTTAEDIEQYVDFLDLVFRRRQGEPPKGVMVGDQFARWAARNPGPAWRHAPVRVGDLEGTRQALQAALGEEPPAVPFPVVTVSKPTVRPSDGWLAGLYQRPFRSAAFTTTALAFGDDLKGDLYLPADVSGRVPVLVWLHPFSYHAGYHLFTKPFFESLTKQGVGVLAFDLVGHGTRIQQGERFYERYPRWSLLGKMTTDTRAAVEALAALEAVDPQRIYVAGFSLGGKVALTAAVLDDRVAGVAVVGAAQPLRAMEGDAGVEGLWTWTQGHGLMPRLAGYLGREPELPFDDEHLLAALGTRRALVVAPTLDRYTPVGPVRSMVERVQRLPGRQVTLATPEDFHRFSEEMQRRVMEWVVR